MSKTHKLPKDYRYDRRHNRGSGKQPKGYIRQLAVWPVEVTIRERVRPYSSTVKSDRVASLLIVVYAPSYRAACKKWVELRRCGWLTQELEALVSMATGNLVWSSFGVPTLPQCFVPSSFNELSSAYLDVQSVRYCGTYSKELKIPNLPDYHSGG